ncbi:glycosyltransferase [Candidatus Clostridium stratigraminis]|uniref:Glycosyltransferase n=1 Tax=Candidatus Clostridium stratigraminis TaxID=3381661 RepID=A0ABW8T2Z7_9CLOT
MTKRCIVHMPFYVDTDYPSGSQIRPMKMIDAFRNIGYEVDVVIGYGNTRKLQIKSIEANIKKGIKYDFMYSESSTEPTLLTEKNHIPVFPFLDFNFLKFCKNSGIKIGLFYRDIHWKFSQYKATVPLTKRLIAYVFYHYDLYKYNRLVDVLYLPSARMYEYIPFDFKGRVEELPPALDDKNTYCGYNKKDEINNLHIFYVGGLNYLYNLQYLFQVVSEIKELKLTVCCRKKEWENEKTKYEKYISDRIQVIHKSGDDLIPYFKEADLFNIFVEPLKYWEFAVPVKLFDYIAYQKPIISTKNTAAGEFIEKNNIGWSIDYSKESLRKQLIYIFKNQELLDEKTNNINKIIAENTWKARAKKVVDNLQS